MKAKKYLNEKIVAIFIIYTAILIVPLFLQTLERPVGLWDYFTAWDVHGIPAGQLYDNSSFGQILSGLFLKNNYLYRPFSGLFYYLFVRIFQGNFWILLCFKWFSKFLCLYILWCFHKNINKRNGIYCFVFSFLIFHTVCFEIMTFSADGFAALFSLWLTFFIFEKYRKYQSFHIKSYTFREYMTMLLIFTLTSGQKEICVVILLTTIGLFTVSSIYEKSWTIRLLPLYLITLFVVIRVLIIAASRVSSDTKKPVLKMAIRSVQLVTEYGVANGMIAFSLICICLFAGYQHIKYCRHEVGKNWFICYLLVTISGMIIFNSISVEQMAARYVIPICFLFGELLLIVGTNFKRIGNVWLIVLGISIPMFCLSNVYAQHLAYANQFEEQQILFDYILNEKEKNSDLQIVVTGKDEVSEGRLAGMELQKSIQEFYGYLGNEWYGIPQYDVITIEEYLNHPQYQKSHALWMTTYKISEAEKQIGNRTIRKTCIAEPNIFVIKKIYEFWIKVDKYFGFNSTVTYDMGSCELRTDQYWNLYTIGSEHNKNEISNKLEIKNLKLENYVKNEHKNIREGETIVVKKGECAKLYVDLSESFSNQLCKLKGIAKLNSGTIFYGFSDKKGNAYCTYELKDKKEHPLEISYFFRGIRDIELFFYVPEQEIDAEFEVNGLQLQNRNIEILKNVRNYGSFQ